MAYLDQMFTVSSLHHRWDKQQCNLVTMASLKLAIKLFEPRTMNMDDMLKLGMKLGSTFAPLSVVEMESDMLWKVKGFSENEHVLLMLCFVSLSLLSDDCTTSARMEYLSTNNILLRTPHDMHVTK